MQKEHDTNFKTWGDPTNLEIQQQVGKIIPTSKKRIAMEIYEETKECNVEGMGKSSCNLSSQELVEKINHPNK